MAVTKRKQKPEPPPVHKTDPRREWDRGTELLALFSVSGFVESQDAKGVWRRERPQSVILVGEPSSGKTELIERFSRNPWLAYRSDITRRGLDPILEDAKHDRATHLVMTEFQTVFMRKTSVAGNCLTTLGQAMEEGVGVDGVGGRMVDYGGARIGLIAGITNGSLEDRRRYLKDMGLLARAAVIPWAPPDAEIKAIMDAVDRGDRRDLEKITLARPDKPVRVQLPLAMANALTKFAWEILRGQGLRLQRRLHVLAMASAVLAGRSQVGPEEVHRILLFQDYWRKAVFQ
jgi:hypothetical protein